MGTIDLTPDSLKVAVIILLECQWSVDAVTLPKAVQMSCALGPTTRDVVGSEYIALCSETSSGVYQAISHVVTKLTPLISV
jgi:hypothetical protein